MLWAIWRHCSIVILWTSESALSDIVFSWALEDTLTLNASRDVLTATHLIDNVPLTCLLWLARGASLHALLLDAELWQRIFICHIGKVTGLCHFVHGDFKGELTLVEWVSVGAALVFLDKLVCRHGQLRRKVKDIARLCVLFKDSFLLSSLGPWFCFRWLTLVSWQVKTFFVTSSSWAEITVLTGAHIQLTEALEISPTSNWIACDIWRGRIRWAWWLLLTRLTRSWSHFLFILIYGCPLLSFDEPNKTVLFFHISVQLLNHFIGLSGFWVAVLLIGILVFGLSVSIAKLFFKLAVLCKIERPAFVRLEYTSTTTRHLLELLTHICLVHKIDVVLNSLKFRKLIL